MYKSVTRPSRAEAECSRRGYCYVFTQRGTRRIPGIGQGEVGMRGRIARMVRSALFGPVDGGGAFAPRRRDHERLVARERCALGLTAQFPPPSAWLAALRLRVVEVDLPTGVLVAGRTILCSASGGPVRADARILLGVAAVLLARAGARHAAGDVYLVLLELIEPADLLRAVRAVETSAAAAPVDDGRRLA